ncbi:MAG: hypothetical protein HKL95_09385, partial [Phycisphaerae bacterium]|nr:hypothetical protein [Phycisphaerae bacterium]
FQYITNKFNDPQWYAPHGASLQISVRSQHAGLLLLEFDYGVSGQGSRYTAKLNVKGQSGWQRVTLPPSDFSDGVGKPMETWGRPEQFSITSAGLWHGPVPAFRNLQWVGGRFKP